MTRDIDSGIVNLPDRDTTNTQARPSTDRAASPADLSLQELGLATSTIMADFGIDGEARRDLGSNLVSDLPGLTSRSRNALVAAGVTGVGKLLDLTWTELGEIENLGNTSIANIRDCIAALVRSSASGNGPPRRNRRIGEVYDVLPGAERLPLTRTTLSEGAIRRLLNAGLRTVGDVSQLTAEEFNDVSGQPADRRLIAAITEIPEESRSISETVNRFLSSLADRERRILDARWGMDDGQERTLAEVGDDLEISRERVRQIQKKALKKLRHPALPHRDTTLVLRILRVAEDCTSVATSRDDLRRHLAPLGLAIADLEFPMIQFLLDQNWVSLPSDLAFDGYSDLPFVRAGKQMPDALRLAVKHARYSGACELSRAAEEIEMPQDECAEILTNNGFVLVGDWCVLNEPSGAFLDTIREMHIYCGDVLTLRRLRKGLRKRSLRGGKSASTPLPPRSVIGEALVRSNEFRTTAECSVWRGTDADLGGHELSGSEQAILECLDNIGPLVTYQDIQEALKPSGVAPITVTTTLRTSPLITRVEHALYAREGATFSDADLQIARARRTRSQARGLVEIEDTNRFVVDALGSAVQGSVAVEDIPIRIRLAGIGDVAAYCYPLKWAPNDDATGRYLIHPRLRGQAANTKGSLAPSGAQFMLLIGALKDIDTEAFVLWDAYAHRSFYYVTTTLEVNAKRVWAAAVSGLSVLDSADPRGAKVVVCGKKELVEAIRRRVHLSADRLSLELQHE